MNTVTKKLISHSQMKILGYQSIAEGLKSKPQIYKIIPYEVSDLTKYGFYPKALKTLTTSVVGKTVKHPLSHYKKTDGKLKESTKGKTLLSYLKKMLKKTSEPKAMKTQKQQDKMNKEKNQPKLNSVTLDPVSSFELTEKEYDNRNVVIKADWDAGFRHTYKLSTVKQIMKRGYPGVSPKTGKTFTGHDIFLIDYS
jgi:hypothetical protein